MKHSTSDEQSVGSEERAKIQGSQTLLRGLDMLDKVVGGPVKLADLSAAMGLTRSTTHRLANALTDRGFLTFLPRAGYQLGPKLLQLGFLAQSQADVVQISRPRLGELAAKSEDTVHLGRLDTDFALYLDKIPGRRRVDISSRVGDRHPLTSTGLGKALLLDTPESEWPAPFEASKLNGAPALDYDGWAERMRGYVVSGHAYDLEENEDLIRCVAAPVRDATGRIIAAISLSSAAQYLADDRMNTISRDVRETAEQISADLGWIPGTRPSRRPPRR